MVYLVQKWGVLVLLEQVGALSPRGLELQGCVRHPVRSRASVGLQGIVGFC